VYPSMANSGASIFQRQRLPPQQSTRYHSVFPGGRHIAQRKRTLSGLMPSEILEILDQGGDTEKESSLGLSRSMRVAASRASSKMASAVRSEPPRSRAVRWMR